MMTEKIDISRFKRATVNLKKVAIFLALIGVTMLYLGWIRYPMEPVSALPEIVWVIRIASLLMVYASLKCYLIARHLRSSVSGEG